MYGTLCVPIQALNTECDIVYADRYILYGRLCMPTVIYCMGYSVCLPLYTVWDIVYAYRYYTVWDIVYAYRYILYGTRIVPYSIYDPVNPFIMINIPNILVDIVYACRYILYGTLIQLKNTMVLKL